MENSFSNNIYIILDNAKKISETNPQMSLEMCKEAYSLATENKLKLEEGYALIGMSLACRSMTKINQVLEYSFTALDIFKEYGDITGEIRALNLLGITYFYYELYEQALEYLLSALALIHEDENSFLLSCVLNNTGEVYRECFKFEQAFKYFYDALKISLKYNYKANTASIYINIGEICFREKKHEEAIEFFKKGLYVIIEEGNQILLGEIENKLGEVYYSNNNFSKAKEYLSSAVKRLESVDNKHHAIDALTNLGKLCLEQRSPGYMNLFDKAICYAEETNSKKKLSRLYKILTEYHEKNFNYKLSLEYYKRYHLIENELETSIIGYKLEALKVEIAHLKTDQKLENIRMINHRLENEISSQKKKLTDMENANRSLKEEALIDELTDIPNRRCINTYVRELWHECRSSSTELAVFMIDIDHFKKYNDYWGHLKGDHCLMEIAACLKKIQSAEGHFLGRFGGEEFIYIAKDIGYENAILIGDQLRTAVELLKIRYTIATSGPSVTISVGGVYGNVEILNDPVYAFDTADKELYRSKSSGRNKVSIKRITN